MSGYDKGIEALFQGYYEDPTNQLEEALAFIQEFMVSRKLSADHLKAGKLDTKLVEIFGELGKFYISGNELMAEDLTDEDRFVRITPGFIEIMKGALLVYRDDGYPLIVDGKANFNFNVQGGTPQMIEDDGSVYVEGQYCRTTSETYKRFDFIRFKHESRYLNLAFYGKSGGGGAYSYVQLQDDLGNIVDTQMTNATVDTNIGMTIDLGVPDGSSKLYYIYIKTTATAYPCNIRLGTKYLNG